MMTKWLNKIPVKGDWIRVKIEFSYHHALYISDEEVLHYCSQEGYSIFNPNLTFQSTSLQIFSRSNPVKVRNFSDEEKLIINLPEKVVEKALSLVGENEYDIYFNNCEHIINDCFFNKRESEHTEFLFRRGLSKRKNTGLPGIIDNMYVSLVKITGGK
jgi:hypothetical protein